MVRYDDIILLESFEAAREKLEFLDRVELERGLRNVIVEE